MITGLQVTYPLAAAHAIITSIIVWLAIKHSLLAIFIVHLIIIVQTNNRVTRGVKPPLN